MMCYSDPNSGSHFIAQTSKYLLIHATAEVIQYISPDPYSLCAKYLRLS